MSLDPAKTLEFLFAIDQETIERDLQRAQENISPLLDEIASLLKSLPQQDTPEKEARLNHLELVQAHTICCSDTVAPELKTYYATHAAWGVTGHVEMAAVEKGTLADINARMDAICRREGLPEGEDWTTLDEAPPDYQALDAEFRRILWQIVDTVFVSTLRRYHLDEQADLFEKNHTEFELQREIGSRVVSPEPKDSMQFMDDSLRKRHGEAAFQRVQSRVKELRAKRR